MASGTEGADEDIPLSPLAPEQMIEEFYNQKIDVPSSEKPEATIALESVILL